MREHDFEPIRGLPGELPEGETVLWQGSPSWIALAQQAFHIRAVGAYFAVMLAWRGISDVAGGGSPGRALLATLSATPIALLALGILAALAWLNSRTTVYTITNRRVVLRFGAAVTKAINLPFSVIESAAVKTLPKGRGDLALTLKAPNKIAFLQLWPHARPWRMAKPQPALRAVADVASVAAILARAVEPVAAETGAPVERTPVVFPPSPIPASHAGPQAVAA